MGRRKKTTNRNWIKIGLVAVLFIAILFGSKLIFSASIPAGASNFEVKGVDVSKHSGVINWSVLKNNGITFSFLKATEGEDYTDPLFKQNYTKARKEGIIVGAYHFFRFNKDGIVQAKQFIAVANPQKGDLLPVLDVEFHGNGLSFRSDNEVIAEIHKYVKTIKKELGIKPIIYTNKEGYKRLIKDNFSDCILWYCDLNHDPNIDKVKWDFWQYSHLGKIEGALYQIDLNVF